MWGRENKKSSRSTVLNDRRTNDKMLYFERSYCRRCYMQINSIMRSLEVKRSKTFDRAPIGLSRVVNNTLTYVKNRPNDVYIVSFALVYV